MLISQIKVYKNNKPLKGVSVSLEFTGFTQMGFTKRFLTNNEGIAYVEHSSRGRANVYINGSNVGSIYTPAEESFYLV